MRCSHYWILGVVVALGAFAAWLVRASSREPAFSPFRARRECAIAILDDTDGFRFETVGPVYALLDSLGLRVTKTVWAFDHETRNPGSAGLSLDDRAYREWVLRESAAGHEIALRSPSCGDDDRDAILNAHARLERDLGLRARIETFDGSDRGALYWGSCRIPNPLLRRIYAAVTGESASEGHVPSSGFYWLDHARRLVRYARAYTTAGGSTSALNPSMPYADHLTPMAPLWFACSNGYGRDRFVALLSEENIDRLKLERGSVIVSTRFADGFSGGDPGRAGVLWPEVREALVRCGTDPAVEFVPAGELLDRLRVIQLVEDVLAEGPPAAPRSGPQGDAGRSLHLDLPRDLLPVLEDISVEPRRLPECWRRAGSPERARVGLLPWLAQARIATDIVPASVFEGARQIGWRERWRLVIRWIVTRVASGA